MDIFFGKGLIQTCLLGILCFADVTRVLCELELTIRRVKVSTTPDGRVLDLFFITDARSISYLLRHPCQCLMLSPNILLFPSTPRENIVPLFFLWILRKCPTILCFYPFIIASLVGFAAILNFNGAD